MILTSLSALIITIKKYANNQFDDLLKAKDIDVIEIKTQINTVRFKKMV